MSQYRFCPKTVRIRTNLSYDISDDEAEIVQMEMTTDDLSPNTLSALKQDIQNSIAKKQQHSKPMGGITENFNT